MPEDTGPRDVRQGVSVTHSLTFDVNNDVARVQFLRAVLPEALALLTESFLPVWGRMAPQQMVEHLAWAFDLSTGRAETHCPVAEEQRERMKPFLYDNQHSPRDFMNPVLVSGLPPSRHASLDLAKAALLEACGHFLHQWQAGTATAHTHPIFGSLGTDEWSRVHFKHVFHHLSQFGLIAAA